jgi:hypothetical protein
MNDLIIVGDEAFTESEWAALERKRAYEREYSKRPYAKAAKNAYKREWSRRNREKLTAYNREWRHRNKPVLVGSLHDLACTGPTKVTGCVCQKIKVYRTLRRAA